MNNEALTKVFHSVSNSIEYSNGKVTVKDEAAVRSQIGHLVELSALGDKAEQSWARYIVRLLAEELGAFPASIHDVYIARGRGAVPPTFTVPAMNLRALSYDAARCVFRVAKDIQAGAFIFEIARSEIGYTEQRPAEYATNILAAAIAENYQGPIFIQGDHFQISAKRYKEDAASEITAVEELTKEAMQAGFFNIDIDTSTLVDINQLGEQAQQRLNSELSAHFTHFIRQHEPAGVTVSVGGEIGEVGGRNSNEAELRAYVDGFQTKLDELGTNLAGLSKISIQTGTSHGGVVLPDGSVAKVKVDFDTLLNLSRVARDEYGMAGAVRHGTSTLPEDAFGKFVEAEACEVHLATNFQNILYANIPSALLAEVYTFIDEKYAEDRKPEHNDEQFHYENRKRALGPFKAKFMHLSDGEKQAIFNAWEEQFRMLFGHLAIGGTRQYVDQFVSRMPASVSREFYFGEEVEQEEVKDLAD